MPEAAGSTLVWQLDGILMQPADVALHGAVLNQLPARSPANKHGYYQRLVIMDLHCLSHINQIYVVVMHGILYNLRCRYNVWFLGISPMFYSYPYMETYCNYQRNKHEYYQNKIFIQYIINFISSAIIETTDLYKNHQGSQL